VRSSGAVGADRVRDEVWSWGRESNPRPAAYEAAALPTELPQHAVQHEDGPAKGSEPVRPPTTGPRQPITVTPASTAFEDKDQTLGAIGIIGTWRVTPTPTKLWAVVTDLGTWSAWWPAISRAEPIGGVSGAPDAARLTFDTRPPLRPLVVTLAVVERQPPHRLVVEVTDGPLSGHGTVTVAEDPGGSSAHYDVELRVRSLLFKPIEPILASATRSGGKARLGRAGDDLARLAGGELIEHHA
jgi:hypothetical protein